MGNGALFATGITDPVANAVLTEDSVVNLFGTAKFPAVAIIVFLVIASVPLTDPAVWSDVDSQNGRVGGVKLAMYLATPLVMRMSSM